MLMIGSREAMVVRETMTTNDSTVGAALSHAASGWPVFPVWWIGLKHNLSAEPPGLSYRFVDGVFAWDVGTVDIDPDQLFEPPSREEGTRPPRPGSS